MAQTFRARQRLRRRLEFERVYREGRRAHGRFMTLVFMANRGEASRLGISATRKLGGAVERNLAKRRLREAFRRNPPPGAFDVIAIPRPALFDAGYAEIEAEFRSLLQRDPPSARRYGSPRGRSSG